MSQTYTADCYDPSHSVATDMAAIENNFAALKSAFSGTSSPSDPVAGMWWLDTTNHILKQRNEANSAWLSVFDMANNKPVIANLVIGDFAAALKDPAAGTAGFRTLGTGAAQACAGNDSRLSDTRTPADASVTAAKHPAYTVGDYYMMSNTPQYIDQGGSWAKKAEFYVPRAGAIRVRMGLKNNLAGYCVYGRIYKNGSAVGTSRQTVGDGSYEYWTEDLTGLVAGDLIQLYAYSDNEVGCGGYGYLVLGVGNPTWVAPRIQDI